MGNQEGIRRHLPNPPDVVDPTEFALLQQTVEGLADPEHGRVSILEKKVAVHDEGRARMLGAAWVLLIVNGIMGFLATVAAIYATFHK